MEVKPSRVHDHINDRGRIHSPSDTTKEALWLDRLACTFRQADSNLALVVYTDNQGAIPLSKNPVQHNASKHIDVRYHFLQDCVTSRKLARENIPMPRCLLAVPIPITSPPDGHKKIPISLSRTRGQFRTIGLATL